MQQILGTYSSQVTFLGLFVNLILTATLSYLLGLVYVRYGNALSNRRSFARNFVIVATSTMLVITIVKSSIALSLGLVGALSIVRFRAAIKEPEELAFLFLNIAIGLGFGADLRIVTLTAFVFIVGIIIIGKRFRKKTVDEHNLYMTILSQNPKQLELAQVVEVLKKYCGVITLKRVDENKDVLEASFGVQLDEFEQLNKTREELQQLATGVKITFVDNKGLY